MKKFAMAAVAAAALSAGVAQAYTVGTFGNGFVVPNVIHNGAADTTVVGLINQSGGTRAVYWTFFDQDSKHITDGCFTMTNKDFEPFIWSANSGVGLEGKRGYLVFAAGATLTSGAGACSGAGDTLSTDAKLSGNAFQVYATSKDVAYTPVIDGDLVVASGTNVRFMGADSLVSVNGAYQVSSGSTTSLMNMRYAIDGVDGGLDTAIVVWSTGNQKGTHTVIMYDDKQNAKSVNFDLKYAELDWFNPETIVGRPAAFTDGFIEWNPARLPDTGAPSSGALAGGGSVFTYSVIASTAFGAVQTVLGSHLN